MEGLFRRVGDCNGREEEIQGFIFAMMRICVFGQFVVAALAVVVAINVAVTLLMQVVTLTVTISILA